MVRLRAWELGDFGVLERANTAEMTAHLGGPEPAEKLRARHRRYVENAGPGRMFVVLDDSGEAAGSIGYWEHEGDDGVVTWETGWAILPEFQGRGLAAAALAEVVRLAAAEARHRSLHAYPAVGNAASNALCRKAGFTLTGEVDFEYPKGSWMRCNDWVLEFAGPADGTPCA